MNRLRLGYIGVYLASCFLTVSLLSFITHAQQVGRNVNMVSGTELPGGDPYLQRQNEPSGAVSTRNPMHLLVGANDYRTVDLPGVLGAVETGDAWQGVFKSIDGGQSWFSTLLPGYPQDQSPEGLASPIKGYEAASDPVVRAGTHGMFYYGGMAFDRGESAPSAAFVARYIDLNNKENADPMEYIDTHLIDYRTGFWDSVEPEPEDFRAGFIDKPWLAVDIPRSGAETCTITVEQKDREGIPHTVTQQFPGGKVYVAYTVIKAIDDELHSTVLFSYSSDCGESWSSPKKLAAAGRIFQGATIAVDPTSGAVYVSWRQFEQFDPVLNINHPNAIFIARSDDGGKKFKKEVQVAAITAFDQPTLPKSALPDFRGFRFNAYPTMTVDGAGRVYIAWSEYGLGAAKDARVVVSTSGDRGQSWSLPVPVDDALMEDDQQGTTPVRCRQVFPSLSLSSGHLMVAYYDFREDILEEETPLSFIGDFIGSPEVEFHHSVDVRVAQAEPGPNPVFTSYPDDPSAQVSRYLWVTDVDNVGAREQTQHNKPNLPLFDQGTKPFMGDYVDIIASPAFVQDGNGNWVYNLDGDKAGIFHAIWADNRDVRLPTNEDWTAYQPPVSDQPAPFPDPSLADYPNGECDVDLTGMRDQNIYTSQITEGLYVGSPSNTKPLSSEVHRAFVAFVRNATRDAKSYRLTVANQPPGGTASFHQFDLVTQLDVTIPAHSSTSRPVFVTLTEETATVHILVQEIETPGGDIIPPILGGLQGLIELNPDVLNPEILNPEILNPEQTSADINTVEIHNPEILNPEILNPEILNPEILNPEILNPEILNPEILNPEILNPEILNPEILNPEILNPEILNPEILNPEILNPEILNNPRLTDITWTVRNDGNTTSSYTAKPFIAQELPEAANFRFQLLIYRIHATPAVNAITCELETEPLRQRQHHELIVDIRNPEILNPEILNPEILNHDPDVATFYAAPGETVRVTLRMLDPDITDEYDLNTDAVALATISHAVDSDDANNVTQPDVVVQTSTGAPIDILTTSLPDATAGSVYSATLVAAGGVPPLTWSETSAWFDDVTGAGAPGTPCEGLSLDSSGTIFGTPVNAGDCGPFTVQVTDDAFSPHIDQRDLMIKVIEEGFFSVGDMSNARWMHTVSRLPDGRVLVAGGSTSNTIGSILATAEIYDPSTRAFTDTGSMTTPRERHTSTTLDDGRVLITGGRSVVGNTLTSAEIYDRSTGFFTDIGAMNVPRMSHTATRLPDGTILIAGGYNVIDGTLDSAERFNPDDNTFTLIPTSMDRPRSSHTSTALTDGTVLLAGGDASPSSSAEIYDPATNTFGATIGNMSSWRSSHTATLLPNGSVLIAGGTTTLIASGVTSAEIYDPESGTFSMTGSMGTGRMFHHATLLESGKVFVVGGSDGTTPHATGEIYDPVSASFTALPFPMDTTRHRHTSLLLCDGSVLIAGGQPLGEATAEIFVPRQEPAPGFFTAAASLSTPRYAHTVSALPNGKVLVAGGWDGTDYLDTAELYDPLTDTFQPTGSMNTARLLHTATLLPNGKVLLAGGMSGPIWSNLLSSAEVYDPVTETFTLIGNLNSGRSEHVAALLKDGTVLLVGGHSFVGIDPIALDSAEIYDPDDGPNGSFSAVADTMTNPRFAGHRITSLPGGKVLLTGGRASYIGDVLAGSEIYDPLTGTFTSTESMSVPRIGHSATLLPTGKVLVAGGEDETVVQADAELYDPLAGTFSPAGALVGARAYHQAVLLSNGSVLLAGGVGPSALLDTAEIYDPFLGTFIAVSRMTSARSMRLPMAVRLSNGRILFAGGTGDGATPLDTVEIYDLGIHALGGCFCPAGDMNDQREYPTATLLLNGKVLIAGGYSNAVGQLASAELYDPVDESYHTTGSMSIERALLHRSILLPTGNVLVTGGYKFGVGRLAEGELYDPTTGVFSSAGTMTVARSGHSVTLLANGKALLAGGIFQSSAEIYDPVSGAYTPTGSMSVVRVGHSATLLPSGDVLVVGGDAGNATLAHDTAEIYDRAAGAFSMAVGSMSTKRTGHTATLLPDGHVLVVGGRDDSSPPTALATAELYDPVTQTFSSTGSLSTARELHQAVLLRNGRILIVGGIIPGVEAVSAAEIYNPETGTFGPAGRLSEGRLKHVITLLPNGKALIVGGIGSDTLSSTELYIPDND